MERVRFFPDFGRADPLWDASGVGISPETLPLSSELKAAKAWQAVEDEGQRLCDQLQQELGDDWEVLCEGPG